MAKRKNRVSGLVPIGYPFASPTLTLDADHLKCNGSAFDPVLYPRLALVYPGGVLPDFRGEFLRGLDEGRGIDSSRTLLSAQGDAIRNITGQIAPNDGSTSNVWVGVSPSYSGALVPASNSATVRVISSLTTASGKLGGINFDASRQVPTATENRPRNVAVCYIVRAR